LRARTEAFLGRFKRRNVIAVMVGAGVLELLFAVGMLRRSKTSEKTMRMRHRRRERGRGGWTSEMI